MCNKSLDTVQNSNRFCLKISYILVIILQILLFSDLYVFEQSHNTVLAYISEIGLRSN